MTLQLPVTEMVDPRYAGLDTWSGSDVLSALHASQVAAVSAVKNALPGIEAAADAAAKALSSGGRLVYLASGSPALISLGDALELPQTYGIARDRILLLFAGGHSITENLTGVDEDSAEQAEALVASHSLGPGDCVITTSASGSTPFSVAGLKAARAAGAVTIGIAGNAGSPLLKNAEIAIHLDSGAEVISGSTRMAAGTAQKVALNMISTLMAIRLGHVHDGLMINVTADNDKLRGRAQRIISTIAGVDMARAAAALSATGGEVKPAILVAAGQPDRAAALKLLAETQGNLRTALGRMRSGTAG